MATAAKKATRVKKTVNLTSLEVIQGGKEKKTPPKPKAPKAKTIEEKKTPPKAPKAKTIEEKKTPPKDRTTTTKGAPSAAPDVWRCVVRIPKTTANKLKRGAKKEDMSINETIKTLIEVWIKAEGIK